MSEKKLSDVERIKSASRHLRGTLVEGLVDDVTGAIAADDTQLSKFHGIYQQDDRDSRAQRRRQKLEPAYSFMIRARIPGGVCTPQQWLAMDALAQTHANNTLRLTTRQAFQFHGVIKSRLKSTIAGINESLLDTLAACGDVNRNVMSSPVAENRSVQQTVAQYAADLSDHLTPKTGAYHEIWLDGEKQPETQPTIEPVYGDTYLPRKFKMGLVIPPVNDVDIYTQDLGFIAVVEDGKLIGFNVSVGGGMGMAHGVRETYPMLGQVIGFVTPDALVAISEAVVTTQRDFGDRSDRRHARLKYTIDDRGIDWFKAQVEERSGVTLAPEKPITFTHRGDLRGWMEDDAGMWHYGINVENGRVKDTPDGRQQLMTGLRQIATVHKGEFRLTGNQNLIISNVKSLDKPHLEVLLDEYGIGTEVSPLRANAMACVGFPTCGLSMAESERYLPQLIDELDEALARHGLDDEPMVIRMTGCPNGCARPYAAEIGLVGKSAGRYAVFLGGDFEGRRLNHLYRDNVADVELVELLDPLFAGFAKDRLPEEHFGDYLVRSEVVAATQHGSEIHGAAA
ncbi:MAG: NADPH-dependent assimilatory sulfite reductase hemoprotein subunit [Lysobacterales bacterium]